MEALRDSSVSGRGGTKRLNHVRTPLTRSFIGIDVREKPPRLRFEFGCGNSGKGIPKSKNFQGLTTSALCDLAPVVDQRGISTILRQISVAILGRHLEGIEINARQPLVITEHRHHVLRSRVLDA